MSDEKLREALGRTIVLVGLMGAGKSAVGRRLATRLGLPFIDADEEIEKAAGCSISAFFEAHGEAAFRDGERRVIARLLGGPPHVLATGGGAYMDPETRKRVAEVGIAIWLKADVDTLMERVGRRGNRPLLETDDPKTTLKELMDERHPTYAEADITVESSCGPVTEMVERVYAALDDWAGIHPDRLSTVAK